MALTFYEEGNEVLASDDPQRSLHKLNQKYFDEHGNGATPFLEGLAPFPGDDEQRSWSKIKRLMEI
jgi:hypothetical protein